MKQRVYLVTVAKDHSDFLRKGKKGITLAMMCDNYPNKDDIRQLLQATLEQEMVKQHLPFTGKTTDKKENKRRELKTQYVDYLQSVNKTHYIIKELTK